MEDDKLTLTNFCQLSEDHRTKYTWIYGNLLASKAEHKYSFHLYQVEGFYVELIFDRQVQQLISIDPILRSDNLLKYLEEVSLESLF